MTPALLLTLVFGAKNPVKLSQKLIKQINRFQDHRFQIIGQKLTEIENFDPKTFEALIPAEIRPIYQSLYLESTASHIESKDRLLEIQKTVAQLDSIFLKDELNRLGHQIAKFEANNQKDELDQAEKDYNKLLLELSKVQIIRKS